MGRQLRRVPLDFDWPLKETWVGFLNPFYKDYCHDCDQCDGMGYSPEAANMQEQWYGNAPFDPEEHGVPTLKLDDPHFRAVNKRKIEWSEERGKQAGERSYYLRGGTTLEEAVDKECKRMWDMWKGYWCHHLNQDDVDALVADDRLYDLTKTFVKGEGWQPKDPPYRPTAEEVNKWSMEGMGHDGINAWACIKARCEREGVSPTCAKCKGECHFWTCKAAEEFCDKFEHTDPPKGEGYQLWETVSEGSPVTPVFAKPEDLATWLIQNDTSVTRDTSFEEWMKFICGDGWAPSGVAVTGQGYMSGTKFVGSHDPKAESD